LTGCGGSDTAPTAAASPPAVVAPTVAATNVDAELEQLKTMTPVDACAWLTPEELATVFPGLTFEVHQKLEPRMSGYAWDSRCVLWAGVGTIDFAKDVPTHTVELFVNTVVSETKAQSNLASRRESATTTNGFQAQPSLGPSAYTTTNTGVATLFFVKGRSEVQINFSELKSTNEVKIKKLLEIAQAL
jgi:hypothetical protein